MQETSRTGNHGYEMKYRIVMRQNMSFKKVTATMNWRWNHKIYKKRARDLLRLRAPSNTGKLYLAVLLLHLLIKYVAAEFFHKASLHSSHLFALVTRQPPVDQVSGNTVRNIGLPTPLPKGDALVNQVMLNGLYSLFCVHGYTLSRLDNFVNGGKWPCSGLRSF